jgi:DNA repair protein RecO (recombination protein O)
LRCDLPALYAAYYIAELLSDWTEDYDSHPVLFAEALEALSVLGAPGVVLGPRLARFELVFLRELGYRPSLDTCAVCGRAPELARLAFSPSAGGVLCPDCQGKHRDRRSLTSEAWEALRTLPEVGDAWRREWGPTVHSELRQLLGHYVTYLRGRQPRLLPYLGS